jgi:hypothetical protein
LVAKKAGVRAVQKEILRVVKKVGYLAAWKAMMKVAQMAASKEKHWVASKDDYSAEQKVVG